MKKAFELVYQRAPTPTSSSCSVEFLQQPAHQPRRRRPPPEPTPSRRRREGRTRTQRRSCRTRRSGRSVWALLSSNEFLLHRLAARETRDMSCNHIFEAHDAPPGAQRPGRRLRLRRAVEHAQHVAGAGAPTPGPTRRRAQAAALQAAGQARDLPVHERRRVARRHVRPEADAREVPRQADARRPRSSRSARPAT